MKIIIPFGPLRGLINKPDLEVDINNFGEFIYLLKKKYGDIIMRIFFDEEGRDYLFNTIIHNGKPKTVSEMLKTKLRDGDVIYIWPALDGG